MFKAEHRTLVPEYMLKSHRHTQIIQWENTADFTIKHSLVKVSQNQ